MHCSSGRRGRGFKSRGLDEPISIQRTLLLGGARSVSPLTQLRETIESTHILRSLI